MVLLVGGFNHVLCSIIYGIILPIAWYVSRWLKPPTRLCLSNLSMYQRTCSMSGNLKPPGSQIRQGQEEVTGLRTSVCFFFSGWLDLGWKNEEQSSSLSWFIIINQNISSYLAKINMEFCQILDMMIYSDDISTCKIISTYSIHSFCGVLWNLLTRDRAQGKPWTIPLGLGVRHGPSSSHLYSMTGVSSWKLG